MIAAPAAKLVASRNCHLALSIEAAHLLYRHRRELEASSYIAIQTLLEFNNPSIAFTLALGI